MKRIQADGEDITEAVQILYDIAHSSMDWGSGFLDNEEMETVIGLAVKMGWQVPDLPCSRASAAITSVAAKFPDQYEVKEIHHSERVGSTGYRYEPWTEYRIERKAQSA